MKHAKQSEYVNTGSKKGLIKKIILSAMLCALAAFLYINRGYLTNRVTNNLFPEDGTEKQTVSMLGDHTVEQPFVAETASIGSIGIRFKNDAANTATGIIRVDLLDAEGNTVCTTELDASRVRDGKYTKFIPGGNSEVLNEIHTVNGYGKSQRTSTTFLKKGGEYTFRISSVGAASEGKFGINVLTYDERTDGKPDFVMIDGEKQDCVTLNMYTKNDIYSRNTVIMFVVLILGAFIFVMLPFKRIDEGVARLVRKDGFVLSTWVNRLLFISAPMAAYFLIQKYVDYDIAKFIRHLRNDSVKWLLNLIIIGLIWWLIYTISNSTRITSVLTILIASAFGFTNYMLIMFRFSPLVYSDIVQLGTALQVADAYVLTPSKYFLWAVLLTVVWCVVCLALPAHKGLSARKRWMPLAVLVVWAGVFYYSIFVSSVIEDHHFRVSSFRPTDTYYKYGCALSFVITWKNSIVKMPEGYDPAKIEALAQKYPSDEAASDSKVSAATPNVIFVMDESFSDLSVMGDFETNQDYMPFYRSISENAIKGWMYSSVFGGSTANSEFECLTGFSMRYLPLMSVPYRSVITEETPSLTYNMKAMGYIGNTAFHPGLYNSYNRNVVYPLLGFDRHVSREDLEDPDKVRDFVSDKYDFEFVEKDYEAFRAKDPDSPYYMFNVTIQNHGGYTYSTGEVDAGIKILSGNADFEMSGQFLNLIKLSDEALEQLINYYSKVDEETVIVLFGDHQPKVDDEFYSNMRSYHPDISDLEWSELTHKVPFIIWSNYEIASAKEETGQEDLYLSANYISVYLKKLLGMPMTGFDKYLLEMYNELPVVNVICCKDAAGNLYAPDESTEFDERLNEYEQIQYNGLIDYKNRVDSFFNLKTSN